jgi:DNA polymerase I-like protein with 3'-5' exonuclease and polymerase domains
MEQPGTIQQLGIFSTLTPETKWQPPKHLPDLSSAKRIAFDVETRDERLRSDGPGIFRPRNEAYIVGLAIGTDDGFREYYPLYGPGSLDKDMVMQWAGEQLGRRGQAKVGANLLYDLQWLHTEGVQVAGPFFDVLFAEALIDENQMAYNLDATAQRRLGESKTDEELYQYLSLSFGGRPTRSAQAGKIHMAPARAVAPYAIGDVDLPLRIMEEQLKLLQEQELLELCKMENALIPVLLDMRLRGIRLDLDKAEQLAKDLRTSGQAQVKQVKKMTGVQIDVWAAESIAKAFDSMQIEYPRTDKTKAPSFQRAWLENHPSELAQRIAEARSTFKLEQFITDYQHRQINGRVHCQFHPLRGDEYGTVSGRLSSSQPNTQQVPKRSARLGKLVRALFVPEEGEDMFAPDFSQIEPRITLHYAAGFSPMGRRLVQVYQQNPRLDCYDAMLAEMSGDLTRQQVKTLYLGMVYGMGLDRLAAQLGTDRESAHAVYEKFHQGAPYIQNLYNVAQRSARRRGFVRTLLKRRARFPDVNYVYKALNRIIQGSAADAMKLSLLEVWRDTRFELGAPLLTVHDELVLSVPRTPEGRQAAQHVIDRMENCLKSYGLRVPLVVDAEFRPHW